MTALAPPAPADTGPESSKPTGLKPVLDVIPEHCYTRPTWRGLVLFARDLLIYGLAVWGLLSTENIVLLVPLWLMAGVAVAGLFVIGHDAAHEALFDQKWLNALVARVAMLPSLHAVEVWVFGHNRVHHGHTLREGMDFVWHPLTTEQWSELGPLARLRHRIEWGPAGAGFYYTGRIWWSKMVRFKPPNRWKGPMRRDKAIVYLFALGVLAVLMITGGAGAGLWAWTKVVVIPFLLFCQAIGWVVYVQHIAPDIRWWPRREWNRFHGQVEGTTVLTGPPGWEFFFHWIMVHVPHHVDMRIPAYHLRDAADAIGEAFPDNVVERSISARDYVRTTKRCKLHDFGTGTWLDYSDAVAAESS